MPETPTSRPSENESHPGSKPAPAVLTVNQVVAYNVARARRALGLTQADTAARLEETTGKSWNAATLGAAERSFDGGRVREFDANELVAFSIVFGQPVAYFFIPPDLGETTGIYFLDNRIAGLGGDGGSDEKFVARGMSEMDLLAKAVPLRFSAQVVDDVNRVLALGDLMWSPGASRVEHRREEDTVDWSDVVSARDRAGNVGVDVGVTPDKPRADGKTLRSKPPRLFAGDSPVNQEEFREHLRVAIVEAVHEVLTRTEGKRPES